MEDKFIVTPDVIVNVRNIAWIQKVYAKGTPCLDVHFVGVENREKFLRLYEDAFDQVEEACGVDLYNLRNSK